VRPLKVNGIQKTKINRDPLGVAKSTNSYPRRIHYEKAANSRLESRKDGGGLFMMVVSPEKCVNARLCGAYIEGREDESLDP
jgi:hypothetical protein